MDSFFNREERRSGKRGTGGIKQAPLLALSILSVKAGYVSLCPVKSLPHTEQKNTFSEYPKGNNTLFKLLHFPANNSPPPNIFTSIALNADSSSQIKLPSVLKANICLLGYYCNSMCSKKKKVQKLPPATLAFIRKYLFIFSDRYQHSKPSESETE